MNDPLREPLSENAKRTWEILLFILGVIAIGLGIYIVIFFYDELPEYEGDHGPEKMIFLPFLPGIALFVLSRIIQNSRRESHDVILPSNVKPGKKKKIFKWKD